MLEDPKKIKERAEELGKFWSPRDEKIKAEREVLKLIPPRVPQGFVSVRHNEPRVLYDTCVSLISGREPRFRLPPFGQAEEEKTKMNKAERFLGGTLKENNKSQERKGHDLWLRELAWFICGGWYAVFPWIDEDKEGNPIFRWDIYDPITVYPHWNQDGLDEVARIYWLDRGSAYLMAASLGWEVPKKDFNKEQLNQSVQVVNYFELDEGEVYNTVLIDEKVSKKTTLEKAFKGAIPLLTGGVGGSPARSLGKSDNEWVSRVGESVIFANMGMFEQLDKWLTMYMQATQDAIYPMIIDYTKGGVPKLKPQELGSGKIKAREVGETLEAFKHVSAPIDTAQILNIIGQGIQRGGLPYVIYGNLPFELSGFALSQLMASLRHKLNPYTNALRWVVGECAIQTLHQYKTGGFKPVRLSIDAGRGQRYVEEFSPDEIPETMFVEVDIPLAVPLDRNQLVNAAKMAIQPPQILSRETMWDEWFEIDDMEIEYERILKDQMSEMPVMKLIYTVEHIREQANKAYGEGKKDIAEKLKGYADKLEQSLVAVASGGQPGEEQPGLAGGAIPPEALGRSRAGERYAAGGSPPGLKRRPQTPEEREESKRGGVAGA